MILVFNPGSSSIKYKLFGIKGKQILLISEGSVDGIKPDAESFKRSFLLLAEKIKKYWGGIKYLGYRVVCGDCPADGSEADQKILETIRKFSYLAPLHIPNTILTIKLSQEIFSQSKHLCYFDSSFFKKLPIEEKILPIDSTISKKFNLLRYGYHGISHQYAYESAKGAKSERVITIHLGAGCSVTAIAKGLPIATSMGFTPMEGVIMQSRSGNIDPGVIFFLVEKIGLKKAKELLNNNSGLAGLTQTGGNMLDILYLAGEKIEDNTYLPAKSLKKDQKNFQNARLALDLYCNSVRKYIGSYSILLGGVDRMVFTGKIAAGSGVIRRRILKGLNFLKIKKISIIPPNEELAIAKKIIKSHI